MSGHAGRSKSYKDGALDIAGAFQQAKVKGPYANCAVYLRATLEVPAATDARMEFGSDDGIKAWINGKEVLSNAAARALAPGQDKVNVRLEKGVNTLLVKITQGGGDWSAYARIRAADGTALPDLKIGLPQYTAASQCAGTRPTIRRLPDDRSATTFATFSTASSN